MNLSVLGRAWAIGQLDVRLDRQLVLLLVQAIWPFQVSRCFENGDKVWCVGELELLDNWASGWTGN